MEHINQTPQTCYIINLRTSLWLDEHICQLVIQFAKLVVISLNKIFSLMKWQSITVNLVFSRNTRFEAICKAVWLPQMSVIFETSLNLGSLSNSLSYISSLVEGMARCSTFALGLATTLVLQSSPTHVYSLP